MNLDKTLGYLQVCLTFLIVALSFKIAMLVLLIIGKMAE